MSSPFFHALSQFTSATGRVADEIYGRGCQPELLKEFLDAHSRPQLESKLRAIEILLSTRPHFERALFIGHWFGHFPHWLLGSNIIGSAVGIEADEEKVAMSNSVNRGLSWQSFFGDATDEAIWEHDSLNKSHFDIVINLAAEHMSYDWLHYLPKRQLVLVQSTDLDLPDHTNRVTTLTELMDGLRLFEVKVASTQDFGVLKRFTVLGLR